MCGLVIESTGSLWNHRTGERRQAMAGLGHSTTFAGFCAGRKREPLNNFKKTGQASTVKPMKSPCRHPGCSALLDKAGYCSKHLQSAPQPSREYDRGRRKNDPSLSHASRVRSSARWQRVRDGQLSAYPICQDPHGEHERRNTTATARQVHHIKGLATHPELAFHADNLMSVCTACHARLEREVRRDANE